MTKPRSPLIFGEILVDAFPDGSRVLGGCALNVAWHLQGLGLEPILVSRIGTDALGKEALEKIRNWDLKTDGIQTDPNAPTGVVRVTLGKKGEIHFSTPESCASDFISEEAFAFVKSSELLYHGTYIMRWSGSRSVLEKLIRESGLPRFVDVNLRPPAWSRETVDSAIRGANWVKANDSEWAEIAKAEGLDNRKPEALFEGRAIENLLLTLGEKGALHLFREGSRIHESGTGSLGADFVDAVGAGDAFSAGYIFSLHQGLTPERALRGACAFASRSCAFRGATTADREFYKKALELFG